LRVLVNPTLLDQTGEVRAEEGCLSFPGIVEVVPRPARVMVRAQNLAGEPFDLPAEGLLARILHHEIDHLDGVLFLERMSPLKRRWVLQRIHKRIRAGTW
jgi:peptide deformylase